MPIGTKGFQPGHTHGFKKGQSGNPGGRAKDIYGVAELARQQGPKSIETLIELRDSKKIPAAVRLAAAQALLDRGHGKPQQHVSTEQVHRPVVRVPEVLSPEAWDKRVAEYQSSQAQATPPIPASGGDKRH